MKAGTFSPRATATAAAILAMAGHASAEVDAEAVFEAMKQQYAKQGLIVEAGSVTAEGADSMIISNISVTSPGQDRTLGLGTMVLQGVVESGNGGYLVGRMLAPSTTIVEDDVTLTFDGAYMEGYYIAGPDDPDPVAASGLFRTIKVESATMSTGNTKIVDLEGISWEVSDYDPGGTMDFDLEVSSFMLDFANMPDPQARATMSEFGYEQLSGSVAVDGTWDMASGDLSANMLYEVDDAADLSVNLSIGGYTPELLAAIQQMQAQMADQDAGGLAMLGMMQQLEVGGLSIEIVDRSLTGRALDFAARQQGTNRESIIAQAKGVLPFALAQLQNPEFAAKVSAAVSAYLDNPRSLRIVSAPAAPVPVAQIMGAAMAAPQTLISVLGVDISANGN